MDTRQRQPSGSVLADQKSVRHRSTSGVWLGIPDMALSVFENPPRLGDTEPVVDLLADFLGSDASVLVPNDAGNKDPAVPNDPLARATARHPLDVGAGRTSSVVFVAKHRSPRAPNVAGQARVAAGRLQVCC